MTRWDYMVWVVGGAGDIRYKGGKVQYVNYTPIPNWESGPPLVEMLKKAGLDGWELITIENSSTYYFKRPAYA